jgi:hypothetical protein
VGEYKIRLEGRREARNKENRSYIQGDYKRNDGL